jgi:hypothetical protein
MNKQEYLKHKFINRLQYQSFNFNYSKIEDTLINVISSYTKEQNINLIVNYYHDKHPDRCKEIDLCLKLNCNNSLFNKIIIINETNQPLPYINDNVIVINDSKRLTFKDFFNYANKYSSEDTINILINSDIVIGENFNKINIESNQALFLTRYNIKEDGSDVFHDDCGSFDTWIWKGLITKDIGNYFMGQTCCDVKLSLEFYNNEYKLKNPCLDLKTYHIHLTEIRNYYSILMYKEKADIMKVKFSSLDTPFNENDCQKFLS